MVEVAMQIEDRQRFSREEDHRMDGYSHPWLFKLVRGVCVCVCVCIGFVFVCVSLCVQRLSRQEILRRGF